MKKIISQTLFEMITLMGYARVSVQRPPEDESGKRPYEITAINREVIMDFLKGKSVDGRKIIQAFSCLYEGTAWDSESRMRECVAIAASHLSEPIQRDILQILLRLGPECFSPAITPDQFSAQRQWVLGLKWTMACKKKLLLELYKNNYLRIDDLQMELDYVTGPWFARQFNGSEDVMTDCLSALYAGHNAVDTTDIAFVTERNRIMDLTPFSDSQKDLVLASIYANCRLSDEFWPIQYGWINEKQAQYPTAFRCVSSIVLSRGIE